MTIKFFKGLCIAIVVIIAIGCVHNCYANKQYVESKQTDVTDEAQQNDQYVINSQRELINELIKYKQICDSIYENHVDPIGDGFDETDLGQKYWHSRELLDSLLVDY